MDSQIRQLKKTLEKTITKVLFDKDHSALKERCLDAVSCLTIFKTSIQSAQHRAELLTLYSSFCDSLETRNISEIELKLEELTKTAAYSITTPLAPVLNYLMSCLEMCKNYNMQKLSGIIAYVISCSIYESIKGIHDFQTCWEMCLETTFVAFNIIHRGNKYLKDFLAFHLCGQVVDDYKMMVNHSNLVNIGNLMFGDVKNYKFFRKACSVYQEFQKLAAQNIQSPQNLHPIEVVCSKLPEGFGKTQQILNINQRFSISPTGCQSSKRTDRLVLFGKHHLCDIRLPDDQSIDDVCFAVYHNSFTYLVLDCSKKEKNYLKLKLKAFEIHKLATDMIIDIAGAALIEIVNFKFDQDDEGRINGVLLYEFIKGELSSGFGQTTKKLSTLQKNGTEKNLFLLGRASFNNPVDICISEGNTVGRKHLFFEFLNQNWVAYDADSTNGSFLLLKNYSQLKDRTFSSCKCLFEDEKQIREGNSQHKHENSICLSLNGYSFLVSLP